MKRISILLLTVALAAGLLAPSADAAKKKKKAVKTTLYFHGASAAGEADSMAQVNDVPLPMDTTKPSDAAPKSRQLPHAVATPNHNCANNTLFPVWAGDVSGKIVGDVKVTFNAASTPGNVVVRMWPDVVGLMCDSDVSGSSDYVKPAGEAVVALPNGAGEATATFKNVNAKAIGRLVLQFSPGTMEAPADEEIFPPAATRILYDAPDFASRIEFKCIPAKGNSCTK